MANSALKGCQAFQINDADFNIIGANEWLVRAIGWEEAEDGRLVADFGDSFLMFISWDQDGHVSSQSIQQYGAVSGRPRSPIMPISLPCLRTRRCALPAHSGQDTWARGASAGGRAGRRPTASPPRRKAARRSSR